MIRRLFTQHFWHELFEAGVLLKALNSLWETAAGIFILSSTHQFIRNWFVFFSREEYVGGGRDDFVFRYITEHLNQLSVSTKNFVGLYLLFHGLLNMFLAYNLYKNRLWAYPFSMGVTSLFLVYQIYRLLHTHSPVLLLITIFDIAFIYLTWHEYNYQKRRRHEAHSGHASHHHSA